MKQELDFSTHINREAQIIKEFDELTGNRVEVRKIMNDGFSTYDFIFTLNKKIIYFTEVKNRQCHYDRYHTTILEKSKVDRINYLIKKSQERNISGMEIHAGFLISFYDGIFFIDITKTEPFEIDTKMCPKHTSIDGNNNMIEKTLYHYTLDNAKRIRQLIKIKNNKNK